VEQLGWLPLTSFIIFIFVFSIGLGPVPWVLLVELMPLESMATASSIVTSIGWMVTYGVVSLVPQIGALLQPSSCYFVFSSVAVIGTVVILVFVPETRGKTRAQVAELFKGKVARTEEGGRINQGANTSF